MEKLQMNKEETIAMLIEGLIRQKELIEHLKERIRTQGHIECDANEVSTGRIAPWGVDGMPATRTTFLQRLKWLITGKMR